MERIFKRPARLEKVMKISLSARGLPKVLLQRILEIQATSLGKST